MSILDILSPLVLLTLMLQCHYCHGTDVPEDPTAEFSVRLYHLLQAGGDQDNIIFSPLSVAVALGMVGLGARGVSLEQIRKVAGFSHLVSGETHLGEEAQSCLLYLIVAVTMTVSDVFLVTTSVMYGCP